MLRPLSFVVLFALSSQAVQAASPHCLTGRYDGGATEIAASLELMPDGHFRYGMSYGALDEQSQGRWESDGTNVYLTSENVTPPRFALVSQSPAREGEFRLKLDLPDGISPQYFNAVLVMKDGSTMGSPLGFDDWVVRLKPGEAVVSVKLLLPVIDAESERFALSSGSATEVRFRFEPNDLGKVAFTRTPLRIDGRNLLLERHDRELRFRQVAGSCGP